jgi:hypothetical protein
MADSPDSINTSSKQYLCPPASDKDEVFKWAKRAITEKDVFLRTQTAYQDIPKAISILMGDPEDRFPDGRSNVQINFQKRLGMEIVANLSNTRPISGYETLNSEFDPQVDILNKISVNHYYNSNVDRIFKKWLQWSLTSTGWLIDSWQPNYGKYGKGDIHFSTRGPLDCWPIQLPADNDYQQAYAFGITTETPLHLAQDMWGDVAPDAIIADRSTPSLFRNPLQAIRYYASPLLNSVANKDAQRGAKFNVVDIFDIYIMDMSVNKSGKEVKMGDWTDDKPDNSWSYKVPYVGQPLPTGMMVPSGDVDETGQPKLVPHTRPAKDKDCLLYPNRRLITTTRHGILRDGPSYWWHGEVPAEKLCLDEWYEFLGCVSTKDGGTLQRAYNEIMRGVVDMVNVSLDPPLAYTEGAVAKADVKKISLRQRGLRIPKNPNFGKVFETLIDAAYYQINSAIPLVLQKMQELMEYLHDTNNVRALALRSQVPAADTVEALNTIAGAITTDRSRVMEAAVNNIYRRVGAHVFQFYTAARRLKELGPNGALAKEDFDFQPDSLVPAKTQSDATDQYAKAREHFRNFSFHLQPGSLHDITSNTERLGMLQLKRSGAMISWWTIMGMFQVPNRGTLPGDPQDEITRWQTEQKMMAELAQALAPQQQGGGGSAQQQMTPELMAALQTLMAQAKGGNSGPGQKPSGQSPPHMVQKSNGHSTIAESR